MPIPMVTAAANMVSVLIIIFISLAYIPYMLSGSQKCLRDIVAICSFLSHPSKNSRIASLPPWSFSTATRSFTHGPTRTTRPHDMIRTSKSLV
jgi:hypothetical protein